MRFGGVSESFVPVRNASVDTIGIPEFCFSLLGGKGVRPLAAHCLAEKSDTISFGHVRCDVGWRGGQTKFGQPRTRERLSIAAPLGPCPSANFNCTRLPAILMAGDCGIAPNQDHDCIRTRFGTEGIANEAERRYPGIVADRQNRK